MPARIRKGMPPTRLDRAAFEKRMRDRFSDPAFDPLQKEIAAVIEAAWDGYSHSRKGAAYAKGRSRLRRSRLRSRCRLD